MREQTAVAVIGAGPAGLAVGACLRRAGLDFVVLERARQAAPAWRDHYERLHLHTVRVFSGLPFMAFPKHLPRYVPRDAVAQYLEDYGARFDLRPRFGETVRSVRREDGRWRVESTSSDLRAEAVVIATGNNAAPLAPDLPGLAAFKGRVLHSAAYRNATPFAGQNVLVVGMGNTGAEIALDLAESGARPTVSVRGGLHVVPRELFGLPIQVVGMLGRWMPVALSDRLLPPILDLAQGRLDRYGLSRPKEGMLRQIAERGRIPLIDVGTVAAIGRGDIRVAPGIASLTGTGARFADGGSGDFDAVILATGYRHNYRDFLDAGVPVGQSGVDRQASAQRLYLVGFRNPASGLLREIGIEAKAVADDIRRQTGNAARQ